MKNVVIVTLLMFIGLTAYGQREYSTGDINTINSTFAAAEGDFYIDTVANKVYVGLIDGTLWAVSNTDDQTIDSLLLESNVLKISLEDDNEAFKSIDLSGYLDNTDNQDLSLAGNTLSLTNDASTVDLSGYLDNTDNQDLSLAGNTLSLTNDASTVDLSGYLDNTDNQDLSLAGNTLSLTNDASTVDLSGYLDNTDDQKIDTFLIDANTLKISVESDGEGVRSVDLSGYLDNTDNQDLSLAGNTLSLTNDATTVDLSGYLDNTDNQQIDTFTFDSNILTLSISDDNEVAQTVDLSSLSASNIYTDNDTLSSVRTVTMNGNSLTLDGTAAGDITFEADGDVGIGDTTPEARLDVEGGTVRFSNYGAGTNTGTDTYQLSVDANGDIIEMNTVKSSKIFYPPAVVIDVSMTGTGLTLDLHQEYLNRYGTPSVKSPSAPAAIPTYLETELDYYITDYDTTVFANVSVSDAGIMTYDVIAVPANNCTYVNVVFVVK